MRKFEKIIVTGGSGFIGSNFILQLLKTKTVKKVVNIDSLNYSTVNNYLSIPSDEKYSFINCNINNKESLSKAFKDFDYDVIFNFAAETHVDRSIDAPEIFWQTNVLGVLNIIELLREKKKGNPLFIQIGTDEVYGSLKRGLQSFNESSALNPQNPYSASKASADIMLDAWSNTYNLNFIRVNCSNNYGPMQYEEKLIPSIIKRALNLDDITIYGDGKQIREWIYVEDCCKAIYKTAELGKIGENYNIGSGTEITNNMVAKEICARLDKIFLNELNKINISSFQTFISHVDDRPGHDRRYSISSEKIKQRTGWVPKESFSSGINKTIKWYLSNTNWVKKLSK